MPSVKDSEIHNDQWGSDHCPISLTLDNSLIDLEEFRQYMSLDESNHYDNLQKLKAKLVKPDEKVGKFKF